MRYGLVLKKKKSPPISRKDQPGDTIDAGFYKSLVTSHLHLIDRDIKKRFVRSAFWRSGCDEMQGHLQNNKNKT